MVYQISNMEANTNEFSDLPSSFPETSFRFKDELGYNSGYNMI